MGRGTVLLGGRMGCRPLWPRDLLDRVCHIRCQTWPLGAGPSWGAGAGGRGLLSRLRGRGWAVFWQGGAGGWGGVEQTPGGVGQSSGRVGQAPGAPQPWWSWTQWPSLSGSLAECSLLT